MGQTLDGRYRIIKLIGEGGMGEVYAAEHVHIDKKYAIKLLKPEIVSNAEAVTRFRQEARSSSSIGHRNIIAIEDFGQLSDGRIYMCMELLNGAALNDMIQQPMPADRLLNILIQTGHGLAAAHAKNIIHRDMKPENIFVTIGPQGEDIPKILDFGIAKVSGNDGGNHLTRTGTIFGTPFYMAPEQALGNPVDARTDIYAVGVIMYECFAGSLPFQGESFMGILTQHITSEPEPVAQRAAKAGRQLPMGLAEIITRCMQKNPAQRFSTMDELVNALIAVYRGIAGPGMSTYMEAFPVGSAQHASQPTPPPMQPGAYSAQTIAAPSGPHGPMTPQPMQHVGSQPHMQGVQGGYYDPSGSVVTKKKSSMGLIIAIIVLLAAGGAIAAVVLLGGKDDHKPGDGSGSALATNDGSGSAGSDHVVTPPPHNGSDHTVPANGSDHTVPANGSDHTVPPNGSDTVTPPNGSDTVTPPPVAKVNVILDVVPRVSYEVYEAGSLVPDVFDSGLDIVKGSSRKIEIRAKGFKPKSVTVDDHKRRVAVSLERIGGGNPNPNTGSNAGSNTTHNLPPKVDCSDRIVDQSKACRDQYCAKHPDDEKKGCNL